MALEGLEGKVALVTGGGDGIGAATARRLSAEGAKVVVVDIDQAAAERLVADLPGPGLAIAADVSEDSAGDSFVKKTVDEFGRLDIAHLNVSIPNKAALLGDGDLDDFDRVMSVNIRGNFLALRASLRQLSAQGDGGSIVLTASISGLGGTVGMGPYSISKHALLGMMRTAAREYGPAGIRVNAVLPGFTETTALLNLVGSSPEGAAMRAAMESTVPLGRWAKPDEIGSAVAWLLSSEASYLSGASIVIDGAATCGVSAWERFTDNAGGPELL